MQTAGDVEGLAAGAHRGRVSGEEPRGPDENVVRLRPAGEVAVLAHRCLENLKHVEAGIFPQQGVPQQPDYLIVVTTLEHVSDHLSRLVDTLLAVELAEERVARRGAAAGQRGALLRNVE